MDRGVCPTHVPISVAKVTAADAARLAAAADLIAEMVSWWKIQVTARTVNGRPFDITWNASRGPPFSIIPAVRSSLRLRPKRESRDDDTKYAMSNAPQLQPAPTAAVPTKAAAIAPLVESEPARFAANAIANAATAPKRTLSANSIC
jgi:hypothetical protein